MHITVTIGASKYTSGLTDDGWVLKVVEKLYAGKRSGKNRVVM